MSCEIVSYEIVEHDSLGWYLIIGPQWKYVLQLIS